MQGLRQAIPTKNWFVPPMARAAAEAEAGDATDVGGIPSFVFQVDPHLFSKM